MRDGGGRTRGSSATEADEKRTAVRAAADEARTRTGDRPQNDGTNKRTDGDENRPPSGDENRTADGPPDGRTPPSGGRKGSTE